MNFHERRWVLIVTAIALVVANLPAMMGFLTAPAGTVYTGIDATAPGDVNVYLSYLEQVRQGHLLIRDLFTAGPQRALLNPFWLALGLFGSVTGLPPLAVYFLSRILIGGVLLLLVYWLISFVFDDVRRRKIAFILSVFASGIGAWAAPFIEAHFQGNVPGRFWPMDLWVSEAFTFLSLHHSPHFLAATILILLSGALLVRSAEQRSLRHAIAAGLAMLALFSFHPFHVVSLAYITVGFLVTLVIVQRREAVGHLARFALAWLIASPAVAYHIWLIRSDPLSSARAGQNILLTTSIGTTVLSYGWLLVAAVGGSVVLLRRGTLRNRLMVAWAAAQALSLYAPIFFNRRLTHGLNVVLAVLAAAGVARAIDRLRQTRLRALTAGPAVAIIGLLLFGMSTLWVTSQDLSFILGQKGRHLPYYFFLADDYRGALQWLREHGTERTIVLSAPITGNFVPGWSGRSVVVGHNVETVRFDERLDEARRFFTDETDAERAAYLEKNGITHVIVGPWERKLGPFSGANVPYLRPAYQQGEVSLFEVVR